MPAIVAPHAGAWIEIISVVTSWQQYAVAPHAGAWIEMLTLQELTVVCQVAPHAGAWIEIIGPESVQSLKMSLPTRERGLKCLKL